MNWTTFCFFSGKIMGNQEGSYKFNTEKKNKSIVVVFLILIIMVIISTINIRPQLSIPHHFRIQKGRQTDGDIYRLKDSTGRKVEWKKNFKKSRLRETLNLWSCAESSTNTKKIPQKTETDQNRLLLSKSQSIWWYGCKRFVDGYRK